MLVRLSTLFFSLFGLLLAGVLGTPTPEPKPEAQSADLAGLSIGDIINALGIGLVKNITATITLDSLTTNLISINFDVSNPLPIELTLDRVSSSAGINGTEFARFNHTFNPPVVVPILGQANSGQIDNVLLTQGALASLDIIPLGVLDLLNTDVDVRAGTIFGFGGIPIPIDGLKQSNVPVTYNLDITG
ncbi:hypothetical protein K435DRAFT_796525 [Dendrothele bispora CBS 962.96]|uniref:Late embryogenesis abundant protein LEA-2 subgroup domain-containing protein n=1 Tax=Dendrothele bispora (strain CBS 962.96) TaxID=1314807 RepID=A0A4S8M6J7_DENBC|nr:hypothetical protein K435DRAFT_796525 [Dendrothele bispora CBS 962.96]